MDATWCHEDEIGRSYLHLDLYSVDIGLNQSSCQCTERGRWEVSLVVRASLIVRAGLKQISRIQICSILQGLTCPVLCFRSRLLTFPNSKSKTIIFLSMFLAVKNMTKEWTDIFHLQFTKLRGRPEYVNLLLLSNDQCRKYYWLITNKNRLLPSLTKHKKSYFLLLICFASFLQTRTSRQPRFPLHSSR